eukprot:6429057-Pyramimonas_sp.AAC.1
MQARLAEATANRSAVHINRALMEASKCPVDIAGRDAARAALTAAAAWGDRARLMMPNTCVGRGVGRKARAKDGKGGEVRPALCLLRQLMKEGAALPVAPTDWALVEEVTATGEALAKEIRQRLLETVPPLAEVRAMLEQCYDLPCFVDEAAQLEAVVDKAEAWLNEAAIVLQQPEVAPRTLRQLLHAGERLPVRLDECNLVRERIKVRECEQTLAKLLSSTCTVAAMDNQVAEAEAACIPPTLPLLVNLRARAARAKAWEAQAAALMAASEKDGRKKARFLEALALVKGAKTHRVRL